MGQLLLVNPKKRGRRKTRRKNPVARVANPRSKKSRRRNPIAANPRRRRTYRRRRNPITKIGNLVQDSLIPSVTAAGGALALDIIMGFLPLPDVVKIGPMRHLVKGAGAIGMGMIAGMVSTPKTAQLVTTGALTVTMYGAGKELVGRFLPQLALGAYENESDILDGLGYYGAGYSPMDSLGAYENDINDIEGIAAYQNEEDELGQLKLEDEEEVDYDYTV
ncbi:MAG: hypothetical protein V3U02_12580 [Calditrichia bacterium]